MSNLLNKIKSVSRDQLIDTFTITVALIIIFDMDTYIYNFLDQFNLPLPSTILTYIWLPVLILWIYIALEKHKKRVFFIALGIGAIYFAYFLVHHMLTKDLATTLYLTSNFFYSLKYEITYMYILILPLFFIYAIYRLRPSFSQVERIMVIVSMIISISIFIGNVFIISPSTYTGWTQANFFSWFSGIYNSFSPRELATKSFFSEGNTTGIVLFMTFPFMLNLMYKRKAEWKITLGVIIQGIAMYCLSTRVATYGVVMLMVAYMVILLFMILLKKAEFKLRFTVIYTMIILAFSGAIKYCPAYVNQQIDSASDSLIINDEYLRQEAKENIGKVSLSPYSAEYVNYYVHVFEDNVFLLSIPEVYYEEVYDYRIDPKFWVDLIFNYDFEQRASGRDFEKIFSEYEWNKLTKLQQMFGFSYSIYMNGGILLEQDFAVQIYTHGYVGFAILVMPWLVMLAIIIILALKRFKEVIGPEIMVCGIALCGGLGCAYLSGHTLDEIFSSIILALLTAELLLMVTQKKKEVGKND